MGGAQALMALPEATNRAWLRLAAEAWWENPGITHADIGKLVQKHRVTVTNALHTEEWEVARLQVIMERMPQLIPKAWRALELQWSRGNAAGALEFLRALSILKPEEHRLTINEAELDGEIARFLARVAPSGETQTAPAPELMGANGKNGATTAHG